MKLSDHIKSLSLKKGDILVVTRRYAGLTMTWIDQFQKAGKNAGIDFDVPIIFVDELDDVTVKKPVKKPECICAEGVTKCTKHGEQPAHRELCPLCGAVLGYCLEGQYCTRDECKYAY